MLARAGEFWFPNDSVSGRLATAGDVMPDGNVAIRTYADLWLFKRGPGEPLADALFGKPCRMPVAVESQGECMTFLKGGPSGTTPGYVTLSEGSGALLHWVPLAPIR